MEKPAGRVLKSNNVKLEGQFRLDGTKIGTGLPKAKNTLSASPQASIVENHPEFAVIELICSCGTKTCLRCEYTAGAESSADGSQTQNGATGAGPNKLNGEK